ncbi:MAG: hypothetical protein GY715_19960 [Planctomycetes bacterium]|nr:hypothetical protein [Planctomycetota bacterium]
MSALSPSNLVWVLIALVIAWFALGYLRVIGYEYHNAVLWHNLRVQVQNLRHDQNRRLKRIELNESGPQAPDRQRSVADPVPQDDAKAQAEAQEGIEVAEAA